MAEVHEEENAPSTVMLMRLAFFRSYVRAFTAIPLCASVYYVAPSLCAHVRLSGSLILYLGVYCFLFIGALIWLESAHSKKQDSTRKHSVYAWCLNVMMGAWVCATPPLFAGITAHLFSALPQTKTIVLIVVQFLLIHQNYALVAPLTRMCLLSGALTASCIIASRDAIPLSTEITHKLLISFIAFVCLTISSHIPKVGGVSEAVETHRSFSVGESSDSMLNTLFNNFLYPIFLIDLNTDPRLALPTVLNQQAEILLTERKEEEERFMESVMCSKAGCSALEIIRGMRKKAEAYCCYRDQIVISTSTSKLAYEAIFFSFEASSSPLRGRERRGLELCRLLNLMLIPTGKDPNEEKAIMDNFKGSLICSLSHELCTPINTIMNILLLMPSYYGENGRTDLKEIALSYTELLNSKLHDFIDYTQIELGTFKTEAKDFCVNELLQELEGIFAREVAEKGSKLVFQVNKKEPLWIIADRRRIRQVLIKLVSNSNKYTSKGIITVRAIEKTLNLDVVFQVKDSGTGISQNQLQFIFSNASERAKLQSNQRLGSTKLSGLGLVIARKICDAMHSRLVAKSDEGAGSMFSFLIPVCIIASGPRGNEDYKELSSILNKGSPIRMLKSQRSFSQKRLSFDVSQICKGKELKIVLEKEEMRTERERERDGGKKVRESATKVVPERRSNMGKTPALAMLQVRNPTLRTRGNFAKQSSKELSYNDLFRSSTLKEEVKEQAKLVVVADDYFGNRLVLVKMLEKLGVKAVETTNGLETYKYVSEHLKDGKASHIRLILMDLDMPIMDGIQATRKIRSYEDKLGLEHKIPIAAVTAFNNEDERVMCLEAGMQYFFSKPIKIPIIQSLVTKHCLSPSSS